MADTARWMTWLGIGWLGIGGLGLLAGCGGGEVVGAPTGLVTGSGPNTVVVELFTSQGCSSCPPADELLTAMARDPYVLPLAFHVDYWNRLGWRDPFSSAAWSERQRDYTRTLRARNAYTPQAVVNGRLHVVGSDQDQLGHEIRRLRAQQPEARLAVSVSDRQEEDRLQVEVATSLLRDVSAKHLLLQVAVFENGFQTPVERGENARRVLKNNFVVRHLAEALLVSAQVGNDQFSTVEVPMDPSWNRQELGVVAFLQHPVSMRIYGAARLYVKHASLPRGSAEGLRPKNGDEP